MRLATQNLTRSSCGLDLGGEAKYVNQNEVREFSHLLSRRKQLRIIDLRLPLVGHLVSVQAEVVRPLLKVFSEKSLLCHFVNAFLKFPSLNVGAKRFERHFECFSKHHTSPPRRGLDYLARLKVALGNRIWDIRRSFILFLGWIASIDENAFIFRNITNILTNGCGICALSLKDYGFAACVARIENSPVCSGQTVLVLKSEAAIFNSAMRTVNGVA